MSAILAKSTTLDLRVGEVVMSSGTDSATIESAGSVVSPIRGLGNAPLHFGLDFTITEQQSFGWFTNFNATATRTATLPASGTTENGFVALITTFGQSLNLNPGANGRIYLPVSGTFKPAGTYAVMGANSSAWFVQQSGYWSPFFLNGTLV